MAKALTIAHLPILKGKRWFRAFTHAKNKLRPAATVPAEPSSNKTLANARPPGHPLQGTVGRAFASPILFDRFGQKSAA